ncbi:carbohydrate ABC transporter permease [Pseudactinotalea suaedae]|uniref:carbohydrate ABC transporter permease n=1 Tax=Pseudactinotalea suaedae TaxID=1524924 RepID=UPI001F4F8B1C|nr:sugar ABC transporter permease [Pseudactinotalea suaedae]
MTAATSTRVRPGAVERRRARTAWMFLAPAGVVLLLFVIWPMLNAAATSLTDARLIGGGDWVGLQNYRDLLDDDRFLGALQNTIVYALVTTPVSVALALALAVALNRAVPLRGVVRSAMFLPFVASLSITAIAWSFLLDAQVGAVISWLEALGLDTGNGLRDPRFALPAVMFVGVWRNVGFFMVMFIAGLQSIPKEIREAAVVDGAGAWRRFHTITLPLLSNTTMFVTVIAAIFSFQAFDQMYVMTGGGPFFRSETLVMLIYSRGFEDYDMGSATAISWVLVAIVMLISLLQLAYFRRREVRY